MVITNMKELCEYVANKRKSRSHQHAETLEYMARVEVWAIEDINYRKNLLGLNNIKRHTIKYGDR